jgi:hypothetical protein
MHYFELQPSGDPYSRAWEAHEVTPQGTIYRGDLSHLFGRAGLRRRLRSLYPGTVVIVRSNYR